MNSFSEQDEFELFLAELTNSAYCRAVFNLNYDSAPKRLSELLWEASIIEESSCTPIFAMRSKRIPYFTLLDRNSLVTGYYGESLVEV
jgi:hypothetical protein